MPHHEIRTALHNSFLIVRGETNPMAGSATILVIEDHSAEARFLCQALKIGGYEVIGAASSGEEALRIAEGAEPDLILADICIEGPMDGIETSQLIASRCGSAILYLSGNSDLEVLERAKLTEPFGYLVKPVELNELLSTIKMALYKKQAQARVVESEEQFRMLYVDAPLAFLSTDSELRIVNSNKAFSDLLGYRKEHVLNKVVKEFLPEEVQRSLHVFLSSQSEPEGRITLECEAAREDGTIVALELHARVSPGRSSGAKKVLHCILRDVTEEKKAADALRRSEEFLRLGHEELERRVVQRTRELLAANDKLKAEIDSRKLTETALRESEERFRTIVDSSGDAMFVKDRSRKYSMVNTAMAELLGLEVSEIIGRRAEDFFPDQTASHIREVDLRVLQGERIEEENTRKIGTDSFTFLDTKFPLIIGGQIAGICGVARNITDRKLKTTLAVSAEIPVLSKAMRAAMADATMAAKTDSMVLITGESGSGKDYIAQYIHNNSKRASGSFFSINCAALSSELAESELFGHEPGAFTGAQRRKRGLLELTEGGTVLLNEIGEMDLPLQAKLLKFLDNRTFVRVGGEKEIRANVRLLAATNRDLEKDVKLSRFRHDLYFRLNVMSVRVPPLRERTMDIPYLTRDLLKTIALELQLPMVPGIGEATVKELQLYHWPGNVRELRNVLERAVIRSAGGPIDLKGLGIGNGENQHQTRVFPIPDGKDLYSVLQELKSHMIEEALKRCEGNKSQAARMLGISRLSVINYLKGSS